MGWNVVPNGLREMLLWISMRYNNPLIYITENGSAEAELDAETLLHDKRRREFFEGHIRASAEAISGGVKLAGYFAWSLMDNFEWQFGYQRRFGLVRVDYNTLERTPRDSAIWYRDNIRTNGRDIRSGEAASSSASEYETHVNTRSLNKLKPSIMPRKTLPDKVLMGYGSDCEAVRKAIYDGVNIVIWSFLDITASPTWPAVTMNGRLHERRVSSLSSQRHPTVSTNLDLTAIRNLIDELDQAGLGEVLHFVSVGGWNGAHLDAKVTPHEFYQTFKESVGDIFHGIDWDLEGNDKISSLNNFFTLECLHKMGEISRLAKEGKCSLFFFRMGPAQVSHYINDLFYRRSIRQYGPATVVS